MTTAPLLGRVSGAVPWALVGKLVRFGSGILTSVIVVRALGADDYGILTLVRVTVAFLALPAGAGMGQALLRFLPELVVTRGGRGGRRLLATGLLIQVAAWALLALGVLLSRGWFDAFYKTDVSSFLLLATILLLVGSLRGFFESALTASYETRLLAILGTFGSALLLSLTWLSVRSGFGIAGILVAAAVADFVPALGAMARAFSKHADTTREVPSRRLLAYSLPFVGLSLLNMITWKQSETLLLGHFFSPREAGLFDLAYRLPQQLLEFVPETIWPLVLAAMSEAYTKNPGALKGLIDLYYRLLFLIIPPLSVFGMVLGDRFLAVLYGAEYREAGVYCQVLFGVFSLSFFGTPLSTAIYVLEKSWANFLLAFVFAVVNLGLDLILIPRYGLVGALIPVAIAIAISPIARWYALSRFIGPVAIPWGFIARAYRVSLPLLLLIPFRSRITDFASLGAACAAAALLVLGSIRLFGLLSAKEMDLIARSKLPMKGALLRVFAGSPA